MSPSHAFLSLVKGTHSWFLHRDAQVTCSLCGCSQNGAAEKGCLGDGGNGSVSMLFVTRVLVEGSCSGLDIQRVRPSLLFWSLP